VIWQEDGKYPNIIVELLSPSTKATDRRETLNFPPSRCGKGVRGLGFSSWAFSHNVKSQLKCVDVTRTSAALSDHRRHRIKSSL
jgi:hypothetical protein